MSAWEKELILAEAEQAGDPEHYTLEWACKVMANPLCRADQVILARAQIDVADQMLMGDDPDLCVAIMLIEEALTHLRSARDDYNSPDYLAAIEEHNSYLAVREREGGSRGGSDDL